MTDHSTDDVIIPDDLSKVIGTAEKATIGRHLTAAYAEIQKAQHTYKDLIEEDNPAYDPVYANSRGGFFLSGYLVEAAAVIYAAQMIHDDAQLG